MSRGSRDLIESASAKVGHFGTFWDIAPAAAPAQPAAAADRGRARREVRIHSLVKEPARDIRRRAAWRDNNRLTTSAPHHTIAPPPRGVGTNTVGRPLRAQRSVGVARLTTGATG